MLRLLLLLLTTFRESWPSSLQLLQMSEPVQADSGLKQTSPLAYPSDKV